MPVRARSVLRHLVSLLTCLAMLHLTLVSSALAPCTSHGAMDMPGMATSMATHGMDGMSAAPASAVRAADRDAAPASDHALPVHSACCDANAPCGPLAIPAARSHAGARPDRRSLAHAEPGARGLFVASAPEPPPPRA